MKKKVIKTRNDAARLASVRVRIWRDAFALAPWDRDHTGAPLVYWSPDYEHDKTATDAPTVEDADGNETTAPGVLRATVYAYEHGGVTVSNRPQASGGVPCGCVWCRADAFRAYYGPGADFDEIARDFVDEVNAYYSGEIFGVTVEEWDAAARVWVWIDGQGDTYPGKNDDDTLGALIDSVIEPGRIVCADEDAARFVGLEYDDGTPEETPPPSVETCDGAGIVAAMCCRWCAHCRGGDSVRLACSRLGCAVFSTDVCRHYAQK